MFSALFFGGFVAAADLVADGASGDTLQRATVRIFSWL
ncbi:hypothetical protein BQ1740_2968 [Bacillus subtilis]|nr:hypothetical protein BQ1740_2968 [Bacillus subtilis]